MTLSNRDSKIWLHFIKQFKNYCVIYREESYKTDLMIELYNTISFRLSKLITQTYSTSFSVAVSVLPWEKRTAIYNIYGFVRIADEIVDTFHFANQEKLLNELEINLHTALEENCSSNPIIYAFVTTVNQYHIPIAYVTSFLDSMRADLHKKNYTTQDEKNNYIYGSAEVVGLMCLRIFVEGNQNEFDSLAPFAQRLGAAFQKVNFLRDLKQDYQELGRNYFPSVDFNKFTELEKYEIEEEIEEDFKEAFKGIVALPHDCKIAVYIAYRYYLLLFEKLKQNPANEVMKRRIRITNGTKGILFFRSYLKWHLRLIS